MLHDGNHLDSTAGGAVHPHVDGLANVEAAKRLRRGAIGPDMITVVIDLDGPAGGRSRYRARNEGSDNSGTPAAGGLQAQAESNRTDRIRQFS